MLSSMILLVAFQVFWLQKVYEEQRSWLEKEADNLFRNTIMELQDSLWQRNVRSAVVGKAGAPQVAFLPSAPKHSGVDTMIYFSDKQTRIIVPPVPEVPRPRTPSDSTSTRFSFSVQSSDSARALPRGHTNRMFRIASEFPIAPDSIRSIEVNKILQSIVMNVQNTNGKEIIIQLNNDSLTVDSVVQVFANKLRTAGMMVAFSVAKSPIDEWESKKDLPNVLGPVPAGMPPHYIFIAQLKQYQGYLWQKIALYVLFSVFLTGITMLAFWLVYNSLRKQERLAQLKNDFISNVTHELKTPIATVSVAIEALNNFNALQNPQLTREYLDISRNELNRLNLLVDKVLKMAIFEQGEPDLQLERFDFRDLVEQILNSMKVQFEKHSAQVRLETSGPDFTLQADRIHLTNVVYNLIDNALKYSCLNPEIGLYITRDNGSLRLSVQDNGIGIAPEHQPRIFDKFYRVTSGDVHNTKGHGLGLSYVANVVNKHGGRIEVESALGQGSRFTLVLPAVIED